MGFDLVNDRSEVMPLSIWTWPKMFSLALSYNWQPAGAIPVRHEVYENDGQKETLKQMPYDVNDGQYITPEDAQSMAEAIQRALGDIPESSQTLDEFVENIEWIDLPAEGSGQLMIDHLGLGGMELKVPAPYELDPVTLFSSGLRHVLVEFVQFCHETGFRIC